MKDRQAGDVGLIRGALAAGDVDLVSFDVFDTLLLRTTSPGFVGDALARMLSGRFGGSATAWSSAREVSVRTAGAAMAAEGLDAEANAAEILSGMALRVVGRALTPEESDWALGQEVSLEASVLSPNVAMIALAREIALSGIRVVAASDMYLGGRAVHLLLEGCGAPGIFEEDAVYVSSDHRLSKASGRLYERISSRERVPASRHLHVGDNPSIDGVAARSRGVRSVVIGRKTADVRTAECMVDRRMAQDNPSWHGFAADALARRALGDGLHDAVASSLAPVLCHFVRGVAERAVTQGVDSVWFMAREGFLLKALYEVLSPGVPGAPPAGYLALSRRPVFAASLRSYGVREASMSQWNAEGSSLSKLLVPLGMSDAELDTIARRHGFLGAGDNVAPWSDPRFHSLAADPEVQEAARRRGDAALDELSAYLRMAGFMGRRSVAVVDVGWAGQIQECLSSALDAMPGPRPALKGYYLALRGIGTMRRAAGLDLEGILFDPSCDGWAESSPLQSVDIYEDICRAPHGSVEGYADGAPVTTSAQRHSRMAESRRDPDIARLQDAVLRYARAWATYADATGMAAEDAKVMAATCAARASRLPRSKEVTFHRAFDHALNFGSDAMVSQETIPSPLRPRSVLRAVYHARWKEGMAALSWGLPLQLAVAMRRAFLPPEACISVPMRRVAVPATADRPVRSELEARGWTAHVVQLASPGLDLESPGQVGLPLSDLLCLSAIGYVTRAWGRGRDSRLISPRDVLRRKALVLNGMAGAAFARARHAVRGRRRMAALPRTAPVA